MYAGLVSCYGCNGSCLDGKEHAVIHIGFQQLDPGNHRFIAQAEPNPGACQAVCLGQGIKFHPNLLCAWKTQETAAGPSVKHKVAVCIVVKHDDIMSGRKCNQFLIK